MQPHEDETSGWIAAVRHRYKPDHAGAIAVIALAGLPAAASTWATLDSGQDGISLVFRAGLSAGAAAAAVLLVGFVWAAVRTPYKQRDALRSHLRDLRADTGRQIERLELRFQHLETELASRPTVIPPGWNAIIQGSPDWSGEIIPPGCVVEMSEGDVSAPGASITASTDSRVWGQGVVTASAGSTSGTAPFDRIVSKPDDAPNVW